MPHRSELQEAVMIAEEEVEQAEVQVGGGLGLQLFLKSTHFESPHSLLYLQRYS